MVCYWQLISLGSNLGKFEFNDKGYYWKLPNGIIFQCMTGASDNSGLDQISTINYPISFKNKVIGISITTYANGSNPASADIIYQEVEHTLDSITVIRNQRENIYESVCPKIIVVGY